MNVVSSPGKYKINNKNTTKPDYNLAGLAYKKVRIKRAFLTSLQYLISGCWLCSYE